MQGNQQGSDLRVARAPEKTSVITARASSTAQRFTAVGNALQSLGDHGTGL